MDLDDVNGGREQQREQEQGHEQVTGFGTRNQVHFTQQSHNTGSRLP